MRGSSRTRGGASIQGPHLAITSSEVDYFEGQIAGSTNWTPGNLCQGNGICYKELENVPHRIGLKSLTAGTQYTFTILLDAFDGSGHPGFANLNRIGELRRQAGP
jgi:hypothetical protein